MEKDNAADIESGQHRQGIPYWALLTNQGVLTPEIENSKYEGSGTEEDPYVVEWMANDPRNPMMKVPKTHRLRNIAEGFADK